MTDLEEKRIVRLGRIMSLFSNENILTKGEIGSVLQIIIIWHMMDRCIYDNLKIDSQIKKAKYIQKKGGFHIFCLIGVLSL
jgi:hypothetical protein